MHSASDLVGDVVALGALNLAHRPADELHPYGYGHYESLATLAMATLLCAGGVGIGYNSLEQLFASVGAAPEAAALRMVPAALATVAASVVAKELLYRRTEAVGVQTHSPVLVASAWHHRSDAFSSVVALAGIAGSAAGVPYLDPAAGLLVSGMVLKAGFEVGWGAVQDITDRRRESDDETVRGIYAIAAQMAAEPGSGIVDVHEVRVRRLGHYMLLDFHLNVDPRLSVTAAYFEKNRIHSRVMRAHPNIGEVQIHVQAHASRTQARTSRNFDASLPRALSFQSPKVRLRRKMALINRSVRSQFQIERDVADKVRECMATPVGSVVLGLSHATVHYHIPDTADAPCITCEVNLRMADDISLQRAREAARMVSDKVLDIDDVDFCDVHVEMLDQ
jgi:cation diffusion facilitator family transporter